MKLVRRRKFGQIRCLVFGQPRGIMRTMRRLNYLTGPAAVRLPISAGEWWALTGLFTSARSCGIPLLVVVTSDIVVSIGIDGR